MNISSGLRKTRRFFGLVFSVSGALCPIIAAGFAVHTAYFVHVALRATGTVVEMAPVERESDENRTIEYVPVFRFQAADGHTYTITSKTSTNPPEFSVGETITVLYETSNPAGATANAFWQLWLTPVVLVLIGAIHGVLGFLCLHFDRRSRRSRAIANALCSFYATILPRSNSSTTSKRTDDTRSESGLLHFATQWQRPASLPDCVRSSWAIWAT